MPRSPETRRARLGRGVAAASTAAALLLAAGCSDDSSSDDSGDGSLDEVTYLTAFGLAAHEAFVFVADEKGYFEEAGIDVTIEIAGGTENYHTMLSGQAHFTYTDFTGLLMDIGNGEFESGDFTALNSVHQNTLVAIVAPESAGIEGPEDLEGKRIGAFAGSPTEALLPAYADLSGWEFDEDLVELSDPAGLFGLLASGNVDALSTFIIQRGVIEAAVEEPVVAFPFNEYLDDLLGTGLVTTTALAEEDPDLVQRFRDAALRGIEDMLADPAEAVQLMQDANPGAIEDPGPFVGQIEIMTPYVTAEGEDRVGMLDEAHVVRCISVLESAGLLPAGMEPDALLGDQTLLTS